MMQFNLYDTGTYRKDLEDAIARVINRRSYILGVEVEHFEKEFAAACSAHKFCVGVGNGTDALRIALLALGVGPGDEVISPAFNVSYAALAVRSIGAKNVYVDVKPDTMLMDPEELWGAVTPKTRAIIPVHLFGQLAEMKKIREIANHLGVSVIEDAAQAHGASSGLHGQVGMYSDAAAFSFYPTKNLGALGEAGGVTTNIPIVATRARMLRDGGRVDRYIHELAGINSGLDELQAAILRVKLPHLKEENERRAIIASTYRLELSGVGDIRFQEKLQFDKPSNHLFVIRTAKRDALHEHLLDYSIPSFVHYPCIVPQQPFEVRKSGVAASFPVSEACARQVLSLPMRPDLSAVEQATVCRVVKQFYGRT